MRLQALYRLTLFIIYFSLISELPIFFAHFCWCAPLRYTIARFSLLAPHPRSSTRFPGQRQKEKGRRQQATSQPVALCLLLSIGGCHGSLRHWHWLFLRDNSVHNDCFPSPPSALPNDWRGRRANLHHNKIHKTESEARCGGAAFYQHQSFTSLLLTSCSLSHNLRLRVGGPGPADVSYVLNSFLLPALTTLFFLLILS